ncbi:hypothetical protein KCV87_14025 [Actinosynnema pretiosum subsp. pretiosum]|uniref:Uncharacterized protein n=1 Tax=Actinosynnema pretiosum subsp. pretiosum TaxID=103721 RepID=A0AA45LC74_9PSEU|nr:hypothetical protein APASM_1248 [Actinosynnema pretiosum subsp. pretiosum]QUF07055.1 hypothetical protein KCV87_14025 [Actinosynnema pretiosum subsp. pretiosum]
MTIDLTATQVVAGLGVLLALVTVWRAGSRRGKAVAERTRSGVRLLSLTGRVVGTAGAIVGAQWVVILYGRESAALWVALGLPALFAGYTLTKALTVTGEQRERRR